jgi:hypothetical protein
MKVLSEIVFQSIDRLGKQNKLLLQMYQAELKNDSTSLATASSRSNIMAVQHTIEQIAALRRARAL